MDEGSVEVKRVLLLSNEVNKLIKFLTEIK